MSNETDKKLESLLLNIDKKFGKGSLMSANIGYKAEGIEPIPTGSIGLDNALGIGGYPTGRIVELYGAESSGKTTLAIYAMINAQRKYPDKKVEIIDAEHAFDIVYAEKLGLDVANLLISQPDNGEQAMEILEMSVKSELVSLVVVDSVAALTPKAEIDGEMGDSNVGRHARLMSQALRKITGVVSKTNTCCIFINQMRERIGVMFGSPLYTTGGNALKFYSSVRIELSKSGVVKDEDIVVAVKTKVKVVKNKVASPFKEAHFEIIFGEGIDSVGELVDIATDMDIINKSGSWYSYENTKLGQGKDAVKVLMNENAELYEEIFGIIYGKLFIK